MTARGIEYRPLVFTIDDVPYFDDFSDDGAYKNFYDQIRAGKMPTTSQINVAEHEEYFEGLLSRHDNDIIHVTLSSGLSGTYESACMAAETVNARHDNKIYVVDSLGATIAVRHVLDAAEKLRDSGMSAKDAVPLLVDVVNHIHTWFMPTDLMHLKRGGRVSGPSAVIGTALNIKPILIINQVGGLSVVQKKIGVSKGIAAMLEVFDEYVKAEPSKVYIANADSDYADGMLERARAIRPACEYEKGWIGPVIGAHTGCGAVGISFLSDKLRKEYQG